MKRVLFVLATLLMSLPFLSPAQETLWYEGFENDGEGWQFLDVDEDGHNWSIADINPSEGLHCLYGGYSPRKSDNWAVSPEVPLLVEDGYIVLEWKVFGHANYSENYEVLITTGNGNLLVSYDSLFSDTITGGYHSRSLNITEYAGQKVHIAFRHRSENQNFICIDEVRIKSQKEEPVGVAVTRPHREPLLYPTLAKDVILITADKLISVEIYNSTGTRVACSNLNKIVIRNLPSGLYSTRIRTTEGVTNKRFVKVN